MGHKFSKSKMIDNHKSLKEPKKKHSIKNLSNNSTVQVSIDESKHNHNDHLTPREVSDEESKQYRPNAIEKNIDDDTHYDSDIASEKSYPTFTLFKKSPYTREIQLASEAAKYILLGNVTKVRMLIKENPSIIYCRIPEVVDPIKRKILHEALRDDPSCEDFQLLRPTLIYKNKTLLQIAAAEGYFAFARSEGSLERVYHPNPKMGLFEYILKQLPFDEACIQYNEQFSKECPTITNHHLQAYRDAYKEFLSSIEKIEIPSALSLEIIMNQNYEIKNAVRKLRIAFAHAFSREVTIGLRFPMQAILDFIDDLSHYKFNNTKTQFCAIMVYGLFQEIALASVAQVFRNPFNYNKYVDFNESLSDYYSSGLGESYFINSYRDKQTYQHSEDIFNQLYFIRANMLLLNNQREQASLYFSTSLEKGVGNDCFMEMHFCRPNAAIPFIS